MREKKKYGVGLVIFLVLIFFGSIKYPLAAATFTGTNAPGAHKEFSFTVPEGQSTLYLKVAKTGNVTSHILLKHGAPLVDNGDYHYASQLDDADNILNLDIQTLEPPERRSGTWYVRVYTPPYMPGSHSFTLQQDVWIEEPPTFQTSESLSIGEDQYYRMQLPVAQEGWRIVLSSTASSDITLLAGATTGTAVTSSLNKTLHTLLVQPSSLTGGASG